MQNDESNVSTHSDTGRSSPKRKYAKRTVRACDECRVRKSKCNGLLPCDTCQKTERVCAYRSKAGRKAQPTIRIRILEERLRRARVYLREAQKRTPSLASVDFDLLLGTIDENEVSERGSAEQDIEDDGQQEPECLDSIFDSYGRMPTNSDGSMDRDFYGAASGFAFIQKTTDFLQGSHTPRSTKDDILDISQPAVLQLFDAPLPPRQTPQISEYVVDILPEKQLAANLMNLVFSQVYPLFHFLDEEEFQISTDRLYRLRQDNYTEFDHTSLALFCIVIGLGYMFSREQHDEDGCRAAMDSAMRYFTAASIGIDITHLRTIKSLQTIIGQILFLISTARLASAHTFVGIACAAAMKQGLHFRSSHEESIPLQERRLRRKVFWAVLNLDIYVNERLGLPKFLDLTAVDPALNLTVESALNELRSSRKARPREALLIAAAAKHVELSRIMSQTHATLFPRPTDPPDQVRHYAPIRIKLSTFQKIENEFSLWRDSFVSTLLAEQDRKDMMSVMYELEMSYHFSQIVLYRMFLHHLTRKSETDPASDPPLSFAFNCVQTASKVISLSVGHQRRGLLCPASWPSIYTVFMSLVCLLFSYTNRKHASDEADVKLQIENGIRLLACTGCTTDTGSVRCLAILRSMIEQVSDFVDINLERICASTKICCTSPSVFNGDKERDHEPLSGTSTQARLFSSGSHISSRWAPHFMDPTSYNAETTPTRTMTDSPRKSVFGSDFQPLNTVTSSDVQNPDELIEFEYALDFSWPTIPHASTNSSPG